MGRVVYAEENLLDYLRNTTNSNLSTIGLIIGQSTKARDYVVHLARTPEDKDKPLEGQASVEPLTFNSVKEVHESIVANHAKHVTRMLPGGFHVIGVFICTTTSIFNNASLAPTLKKILFSIKKTLSSEPFPVVHGQSEKLLLHYNPVDQKYSCNAFDVNNLVLSAFKSVEWKFQKFCTKWCQIGTKFDMNWPSIGGRTSLQLKTQLKDFLSEVNKLLDPAIVAIGGKIHSQDSVIETLIKNAADKKNKNSNDVDYLEASVFIPLENLSCNEDMVVSDCDVELRLMGVLTSGIFISSKGTVEEAVKAVKEDIIRSLAARMELHWDSLIEEEYGSPEEKQTIHEPPRRVSVSLPNSPIRFNDYIFPGEDANEVITTFKELLDINITEANVNEVYEIHGDPSDLCGKPSVNVSPTSSDDMLNSSLPTGFLIAAISFAIMLIGIALALQLQRNSSSIDKKN